MVEKSLDTAHKEFLEFNKARSGVLDHPGFYQKIERSELDRGTPTFYLSRWLFEDDVISNQDLVKMREELNLEYYTWGNFSFSLKRLIDIQKKEAFKSFFIIIVFLLILFFGSKRGLVFMILWLAFMLLFNHFFILYGRVTILFFILGLVPLFYDFKREIRSIVFYPTILLLVVALLVHSKNFIEEAAGRRIMEEQLLDLFDKIPEGKLILIEGNFDQNHMTKYSRLNPVPYLSLSWISRSPEQKKALSRFGLKELKGAREYYLIGIKMEEPLEYNHYMDQHAGDFKEKMLVETSDFRLFYFRR